VVYIGSPECVTSAYMQVHQLLASAAANDIKRGQKRVIEDVYTADLYAGAAGVLPVSGGGGAYTGAALSGGLP